jgi:endonuclease-3
MIAKKRVVTRPRTAAQRRARAARILRILEGTYPGATTALTYRTPWELLAATILSAQCTD